MVITPCDPNDIETNDEKPEIRRNEKKERNSMKEIVEKIRDAI